MNSWRCLQPPRVETHGRLFGESSFHFHHSRHFFVGNDSVPIQLAQCWFPPVVNFDLWERFPRPRSRQRGSLRPRARRVAVLGVGAEGTNEYNVICRNASVLAFRLWPTIFTGAPFRLQNICRNGVPPRSRTTTALYKSLSTPIQNSPLLIQQTSVFYESALVLD